jgi:flagellar hook-associated protein 1 FlgK
MGVDTDAEMQTLLLIEQSYAANAKVVETVDFLIRTLMEI